MESKFVLFDEKYGVKWYRCLNCGALQRGAPPPVCPVCEGKYINREEKQ